MKIKLRTFKPHHRLKDSELWLVYGKIMPPQSHFAIWYNDQGGELFNWLKYIVHNARRPNIYFLLRWYCFEITFYTKSTLEEKK